MPRTTNTPFDKIKVNIKKLLKLNNYTNKKNGLTKAFFDYESYLHERDFIFAIICEELGTIGGVIVILLFATLIYIGYSSQNPVRTFS